MLPCSLPLLLALLAVPGDAGDDWRFDVLRLKNGRTVRGLVLEEGPLSVRFRYVAQRPGLRTVVFPPTTFARAEVERIDRLDAAERNRLVRRLEAIASGDRGEAERLDDLPLKPVPWGKDGKGRGWAYWSEHFELRSDAREDIVRRAADRLEQVFAAYARFLPPRHPSAAPVTLLVVQSPAEYRELSGGARNPAFYDPARNRVVCACDLEQLGEQLERVRHKHRQQLERLKEQEAELNRQYKGKIPAKLREPLLEWRQKIDQADKANDERFQAATRRLFQTLYHEAFHAYLANQVYPPTEAEVPRWLNEGLAQIFESAVFEAGELRVGHADPDRLRQVKEAVRKSELLPLGDLLRAGPRDFLVAHAGDEEISDRTYSASRALAFYLTFEKRLLSGAMDRYVRALKRGAGPLAAFQELVGQPPAAFEKEFHQYLRALRSDGSVTSP